MIYIGTVKTTMVAIDKDILQFFREYEPQQVVMPDDDEGQKRLKTNVIKGFISGKMQSEKRNDGNLMTRDCLILDLDDVLLSEPELIEAISKGFKGEYNYVIYPTISHGLKGVRYRLVMPMDRPVVASDYKLIVRYFSNDVLKTIIGKPDGSNETWSQIQLLPTVTQYVQKKQIIISEGDKLPVPELLHLANKWQKDQQQERKTFTGVTVSGKSSGRKGAIPRLLEEVMSGISEPGRNVFYTRAFGTLLRANIDTTIAMMWCIEWNQNHCEPPLANEELYKVFESVIKRESERSGHDRN